MPSNLKDIGFNIVAKGSASFNKAMTSVAKSSEVATKSIAKSSKAVEKSTGIFEDVPGQIDNMVSSMLNMAGVGDVASANIGKWASSLAKAHPIIAATVLVVAGLATTIFKLGMRASEIEPVERAFNNIVGAVRSTDIVLQQLNLSAAGTISEFDTMVSVNRALAGTGAEMRAVWLDNLPAILEIARSQAAATGESVDHLFESLIGGIKRGSPLLIDNTGLVLNMTEANEAFADSMGITVEQMTDSQKTQALMNETLRAGQLSMEANGDAMLNLGNSSIDFATASQETLDKLQAISDESLNSAEKMGAIQVMFQDMWDDLAMRTKPIFDYFLDIVFNVARAVESWYLSTANSVGNMITKFNELVAFWAPVTNWFVGVWDWVASSIGRILTGITSSFAAKTEGWWEILVQFGSALSSGAVNMIGSFANGLAWAANRFVLPVIEGIATLIADFLVGASPPPRGPLSRIDEGGANTMEAWIGGFTGVSLDPIEQVTQTVANMVGNVTATTLSAIESRLGQLDNALRPFENRVKILTARMDALRASTEEAFKGIDREQARLIDRLNAGDAAAAARITQLDIERAALQGNLDTQQAIVDSSKRQLSMVKAQQVGERLVLMERKRNLETQNKMAESTKKVTKGPSTAKATPTGGAGGDAVAPVGVPSLPEIPEGDERGAVGSLVGNIPKDTIADVAGDFASDFWGGITAEGIDTGEFDLFGENIEGIGEQFDRIGEADFGETVGGWFDGIGDSLQESFVDPFSEKVEEVLLFFTGDEEGSLKYGITNMFDTAGEWIGDLGEWATLHITDPIKTSFDELINYLTNPMAEVGLAASLSAFFTGGPEAEGSLQYFLFQGYQNFLDWSTMAVPNAFSTFGLAVWNNIAVPMIDGLNWIIAQATEWLDNLIPPAVENFLATIIPGFVAPDANNPFEIPRAPPSWVAGAQTGGAFQGPGMLRVGEAGQEMMSLGSADRVGVFPNNFVSSMDALNQTMVSGLSVGGGGGSSSSTTNNNTNNFNFSRGSTQKDERRMLLLSRLFNR